MRAYECWHVHTASDENTYHQDGYTGALKVPDADEGGDEARHI